MLFRLPLILSAAGFALSSMGATGQQSAGRSSEVSRVAPPLFKDALAPLLTPLKTVLDRRGDFKPGNEPEGIVLLDETIVHTDKSGKRLVVQHRVEEALTQSGADSLAEETCSYRTADQKIHLIEAKTILADGRELPLDDRAAFLESPQAEAGDSVYGDRGELRMIFSAIKPGAVREYLIVIEDDAERIPGHFTLAHAWGSYWPLRAEQLLVLAPNDLAERIKATALGTGVPEAQKDALRDGWTRLRWSREKQQALHYEPRRPPADQIGPMTMLSTLRDWDALGDWYRALLAERAALPPTLINLLRDWTRDAKTDEDKLASVITHVSRDIRYTGLEFGLGGLQPRSADEIWKTGYGDCKDKSNLAVLLLREAGIDANLVLLQTEHKGRVDKRCPDYRPFNHAIVVADIQGKRIFCDPTIRYGTPGMLSAADADREVLIVKKEGVEWTRTPVFKSGDIHYRLDAALDDQGVLEGWLELFSTGYFYASDRAYYEDFSNLQVKRDLQETLTSLLPGARLIDAEVSKPNDEGRLWRCFFSRPNQEGDDDQQQTLHFPADGGVSLSMEDSETRETPRFLYPVIWRVSGRISLPPGWQAAEIPPAFDLHTPSYDVHAAWKTEGAVCLPDYTAAVTNDLLLPADHAAVWRGAQALQHWLRKPLRLARGKSASAPVTAENALEKLPLMPTGAGQLTFVDERYPEDGNKTLRRAALKKVLQYFPDDAETAFSARAKLAMVDQAEQKTQEALEGLQSLLASPSAKVSDETVAWAKYLRGLVYEELKKPNEALKDFDDIIAQSALSPYRRGWACLEAGINLHNLKENEKALSRVKEGLKLHDSDTEPGLLALGATALFELQRQSEFETMLKSYVQERGSEAEAGLVRIAHLASAWSQGDKSDRSSEILRILRSCSLPEASAELSKAIEEASASAEMLSVTLQLQRELQDYLTKNADLPALKPPATGWPSTLEATLKGLQAADEASDSDLACQLGLRSLTAFPANASFGKHLWKTAAHLDRLETDQHRTECGELLKKLLSLGDRLPKSDHNFYEVQFLKAHIAERRRQDWSGAAEIYAGLLKDKEMPESFFSAAITREADCHEQMRDWSREVATLSELEKLTHYSNAADGLLRAAHLRLEMGQADEALRLMQLVSKSRDFAMKNSSMAETMAEILDLTKDEKAARAWWNTSARWWPAWQKMQTNLGIADTDIEPMLTDAAGTGTRITEATQKKDVASVRILVRQVAHDARWLPSRTYDLVWLSLYRLPLMFPEQRQSLLALVEDILVNSDPRNDDQRRSRWMYLTISHMDRDAPVPAMKNVRDYFHAFPGDSNQISFVMSRLQAMLALILKEDQAEAIANIERDLRSPEMRQDRGRSVGLLADLYAAMGQQPKQLALLKAEIDHPAIATDAQQQGPLKERLNQLTAGAGISEAVKRWLSRHAPPWLTFAKPNDLSELQAETDFYAAVQKFAEKRDVAESIKIYFLAAGKDSAAPAQIEEWWFRGLNLMLRFQYVTEAEFKRQIDDILDDAGAPAGFKDPAFRAAYVYAGDHEERDLLTYLRNKMKASQMSSYTADRVAQVDAVLNLDLDNPAQTVDLISSVARKRDESLFSFTVSRITDRAVAYGKQELLLKVSDTLSEIRKQRLLDTSDLQSLRLALVRAISSIRRLKPLQDAMADVVAHYPPDGEVEPLRLLGTINYPVLPSAQFMCWVRSELSRGKRPCQDLALWFGYLDACSEFGAERTSELRRKLIEAAIRSVKDDETAPEIVLLAASGCDLDSAAEREHLMRLLKPWREASAMPQTYAQIRIIEAKIAQRTGERLDLEPLNQLKGPRVEDELLELKLTSALMSQDAAAAGALIDGLDPDVIFDSSNISLVMRALKLCGRKDELELATESAHDHLYRAVLLSWTGVSNHHVRKALHLAEALGEPEALPPEWLDYVRKAYPERHAQLAVELTSARLKKDWQHVLAAATEAIQKYPTFYSTYWDQAEALCQLDRKAEAAKPLQVYLEYCHDESNYPRAQNLMKELAP